ncbi:enzymatic polyprotein [Tanacetum coccineum]
MGTNTPQYIPKIPITRRDNDILNLDCETNIEEIIQDWNNRLSAQIQLTEELRVLHARDLLNFIIHKTSGNVYRFIESLDELELSRIATTDAMTTFKNVVARIVQEFTGRIPGVEASNEAFREHAYWRLINLKICNMCYLDPFICEFSDQYYKLDPTRQKAALEMFFNKLPESVSTKIKDMYNGLLQDGTRIQDTLGARITTLKAWIRQECLQETAKKEAQVKLCCEMQSDIVGHYANTCPKKGEKKETEVLKVAYDLGYEPLEDSDIDSDIEIYAYTNSRLDIDGNQIPQSQSPELALLNNGKNLVLKTEKCDAKLCKYISGTFSQADKNYSTYEKETLACLRTLKKWKIDLLETRTHRNISQYIKQPEPVTSTSKTQQSSSPSPGEKEFMKREEDIEKILQNSSHEKQKWYVIFNGPFRGIYNDWAIASTHIIRKSVSHKSYLTKEAAEKALGESYKTVTTEEVQKSQQFVSLNQHLQSQTTKLNAINKMKNVPTTSERQEMRRPSVEKFQRLWDSLISYNDKKINEVQMKALADFEDQFETFSGLLAPLPEDLKQLLGGYLSRTPRHHCQYCDRGVNIPMTEG